MLSSASIDQTQNNTNSSTQKTPVPDSDSESYMTEFSVDDNHSTSDFFQEEEKRPDPGSNESDDPASKESLLLTQAIKSLNIVDANLRDLLPISIHDEERPSAQYIYSFRSQMDDRARLRVKFGKDDVAPLKRVLPKLTGKDIKSRLASFSDSLGVFAAGSVITGVMATATFEEFVTARGLSFLAGPWAWPIAGLFTAFAGGALWLETERVREFVPHFVEALKLYERALCETEEMKGILLKQATDKLEQFGFIKLGKSKLEANWEMPTVLTECTRILLAKIHFVQDKGPDAYIILQGIKTSTNDDSIRGMCIAGQIDILTTEKLAISEAALLEMKAVLRGLNLYPSVDGLTQSKVVAKLLNHNTRELMQEHPDLLQFYYENVCVAYAHVVDIIMRKVMFGVCHIEQAKLKLNRIIDYKELSVLRHLNEHGKYAELAFQFVQALSLVVYQEYYTRSYDNLAMKHYKGRAQDRLIECKNLAGSLGHPRPNTPQAEIVAAILSYVDYYLAAELGAEIQKEQMQRSILSQFEYTKTTPLRMAENALRDEPDTWAEKLETMADFAALRLGGNQ